MTTSAGPGVCGKNQAMHQVWLLLALGLGAGPQNLKAPGDPPPPSPASCLLGSVTKRAFGFTPQQVQASQGGPRGIPEGRAIVLPPPADATWRHVLCLRKMASSYVFMLLISVFSFKLEEFLSAFLVRQV